MNDDPFSLLGLPRGFRIDAGQVESAYLRRAAGLHPDFADDDPDATDRTAKLNEARGILLDDERRAVLLLRLLGGPESDELPDGFLMEIMEIRMQIEGEADEPGAHKKWRQWADERRKGHMDRVAELFDAGALPEVRTELNAWRYTERLIEQLDPDHRGSGPGSPDDRL